MKDDLFKEHHQLRLPRRDKTTYSKFLKLTKYRTRGFANMDRAINMAYFVCGKLHLFTHPIRYRASLFCDNRVLMNEK